MNPPAGYTDPQDPAPPSGVWKLSYASDHSCCPTWRYCSDEAIKQLIDPSTSNGRECLPVSPSCLGSSAPPSPSATEGMYSDSDIPGLAYLLPRTGVHQDIRDWMFRQAILAAMVRKWHMRGRHANTSLPLPLPNSLPNISSQLPVWQSWHVGAPVLTTDHRDVAGG